MTMSTNCKQCGGSGITQYYRGGFWFTKPCPTCENIKMELPKKEQREEVIVCPYCYGKGNVTELTDGTLKARSCSLCNGKGRVLRETLVNYREVE